MEGFAAVTNIEAPIVRADFEEAGQLAEYYSTRTDLQFVKDCIQKLSDLSEPGVISDPVFARALFDAALIAYRRCFNRKSLRPQDLDGHPKQPLNLHDHVYALASKLVAHSVNAYEEVGVGLVLHPNEKEGRVIGAAALGHRLVGWQAQDLQQFDRLASLVLTELVEPKIAELESQVHRRASEIPIHDLYSLPRLNVTIPRPNQAGKGRK